MYFYNIFIILWWCGFWMFMNIIGCNIYIYVYLHTLCVCISIDHFIILIAVSYIRLKHLAKKKSKMCI